ncbi:subtilase-type protease inhibitor [Streptomyces sp. NBC_00121]|uniref:SSI family serine proteinase inhibitor n=1 Tax=unclassified Streptomyces TaxID=2593676 RepID=UPI0028C3A9F1|nr:MULTISPECIES: SSI family serine proteinase inhibitor [unclassified Streptomyces]WNO65771.1 SSI family serine proteinase inhibitor [Streptomyces sp. AM2-3-1]WSC70308.1 subtilase-type protease inhibitor [Streptomyces sp. NBC_01760]WTE60796.1 subtilase-type protease inhibitor [Streptomyces sp. NBC_01617]WTI88198.1 subtilase-type protease inhibitor [Streptomyces sp. NBC_00724]
MIISTVARRLAAASLTAAALAAPLLMSPTAHADSRETVLFLTVSGSENTWIRGIALQCPATPQGHHPRAAEVCAALDEAGGDFDRLPGDPHLCPLILDPVTVTAKGTYDGDTVDWQRTYPNACAMEAAAGPVFAF